MKAKLLTLALLGMMSLSFMSCEQDDVVPSNDVSIDQAQSDCECEGGLSDREDPRDRNRR